MEIFRDLVRYLLDNLTCNDIQIKEIIFGDQAVDIKFTPNQSNDIWSLSVIRGYNGAKPFKGALYVVGRNNIELPTIYGNYDKHDIKNLIVEKLIDTDENL